MFLIKLSQHQNEKVYYLEQMNLVIKQLTFSNLNFFSTITFTYFSQMVLHEFFKFCFNLKEGIKTYFEHREVLKTKHIS